MSKRKEIWSEKEYEKLKKKKKEEKKRLKNLNQKEDSSEIKFEKYRGPCIVKKTLQECDQEIDANGNKLKSHAERDFTPFGSRYSFISSIRYSKKK